MSDGKVEFSMSERTFWWLRFLMAVVAVSGMALAGAKWGVTRASIEDIEATKVSIRTLDSLKMDKIEAMEAHRELDTKVHEHAQVLGNVRDNLLIMMERQRLQPKPLPDALPAYRAP